MDTVSDVTNAIAELFPAVYLRFHVRRPKPGRRLDNTAASVLIHLHETGPLTIGEAAKHLNRAQSVISEIVTRLERRRLIARMRDERDRRRVLVWLTPEGLRAVAEQRQVLSPELLRRAVTRMSPAARQALVAGMQALVAAAQA
jgi:DNA-binding MarR family transcriptional regulator